MAVEEFFRDGKGVGNGFALRPIQATTAGRFDRLMPVVVLAYLLLTGLGLRALAGHRAGAWSSTNRGQPCSAAVIGRSVLGWFRLSPAEVLAVILVAMIAAAPNWG